MKLRLIIFCMLILTAVGGFLFLRNRISENKKESTENTSSEKEMPAQKKTNFLFKFLSTGQKEIEVKQPEPVEKEVVIKDLNTEMKPDGKVYTNKGKPQGSDRYLSLLFNFKSISNQFHLSFLSILHQSQQPS